jgi:hypothetical protein
MPDIIGQVLGPVKVQDGDGGLGSLGLMQKVSSYTRAIWLSGIFGLTIIRAR